MRVTPPPKLDQQFLTSLHDTLRVDSLGPPALDVCELLTDRHYQVLRRPTRHATTMLNRRASGKFRPRSRIGELVPVSRTTQHYDRFRASSTATPSPSPPTSSESDPTQPTDDRLVIPSNT